MAIDDADPGHHEGGENYFVSMTDMMVGMLFIFIILLMSFALVFRQTTDTHVADANEIRERLTELQSKVAQQIAAIQNTNGLRDRLLQDLKEALKNAGLDVKIDAGVLHLTQNDVTFPFKSAELLSTSRDNVRLVADVLAQVLPRYLPCGEGVVPPACLPSALGSVDTVFLEGHTDKQGEETPAGRQENWRLSTERAVATFREIISRQPELDQLKNRKGERVLSVAAYASSRPAVEGDDAAAYAQNRRIDLRFVMDTDPSRGLQEMQSLLDEMRTTIDRLRSPQP
jgi:flagellar motor protein MotB